MNSRSELASGEGAGEPTDEELQMVLRQMQECAAFKRAMSLYGSEVQRLHAYIAALRAARAAPEPVLLEAGRHLDADALPDDLAALRGRYFLSSDRAADAFDAALAEIVRLRAAALPPAGGEAGAREMEDALLRIEVSAANWLDRPVQGTSDTAELSRAVEVLSRIRSEARAALAARPAGEARDDGV